VRTLIESEKQLVYVKEEVIDVAPNPKLTGRVIMKVQATYLPTAEVPTDQLTLEDANIRSLLKK
jgi:hypothetical protein